MPKAQSHLIRPAIPQDAPSIATIKIESWRAAYSHILKPETLANLDHAQETDQFLHRILNQEHILVATNSQKQPIAYSLWIQLPPLRFTKEGKEKQSKTPASIIQTDWPHRNMLASLYVHPLHTGLGIGTALIRANAQLALTHHHNGMMIGVFQSNTLAHALYKKLGAQFVRASKFEVDGTGYPEFLLSFDHLELLAKPDNPR